MCNPTAYQPDLSATRSVTRLRAKWICLVKHGTDDKIEELILLLIVQNFNSHIWLFFFTSTYFYIYLSVKAIINFVITMEFKEFSTRQLLMTMFGFKTINCFIKKNYIWSFKKLCNNSKKIYFTPAECDIFSLTSVTYLGFYFMILCCLNNYLLVFPIRYYL